MVVDIRSAERIQRWSTNTNQQLCQHQCQHIVGLARLTRQAVCTVRCLRVPATRRYLLNLLLERPYLFQRIPTYHSKVRRGFHRHFEGCFPGKAELASTPPIFSLILFGKEPSAYAAHAFYSQMPFHSAVVKQIGSKLPAPSVAWLYPLLIHQWTPDGKDVVLFSSLHRWQWRLFFLGGGGTSSATFPVRLGGACSDEVNWQKKKDIGTNDVRQRPVGWSQKYIWTIFICSQAPFTLEIFISKVKQNFVKQNFWNILSHSRTCSTLQNRISEVVYFESGLFTLNVFLW